MQLKISKSKGLRMPQEGRIIQKEKEKSDGEWGIHFSADSLPEERFDPFHSYYDKNKKRIGHRTIISPIRLKRPIEFTSGRAISSSKNPIEKTDTFCKLTQGVLPAILLSKDHHICDDLFSIEPKTENLEKFSVFSAINLYPPISRVLMNKSLLKTDPKGIPSGLAIIHVFTRHYTLPEEIPRSEWITFFQNYRLTLRKSLIHPKISSDANLDISSFFNIGSRAGASISHLHAQTILRFNQIDIGNTINSYLKSSKQNEDNCLKCQFWSDNQEAMGGSEIQSYKKRVIFRNDHWIALIAYAPRRDGQIRLIPREHISNLWSMNDDELSSLASMFIKINKKLTSFIEKHGNLYQLSIDRNVILYQQYSRKEDHFHMFIDILPVQQTGGVELSSQQKFSVIYPEKIAHIMNSKT